MSIGMSDKLFLLLEDTLKDIKLAKGDELGHLSMLASNLGIAVNRAYTIEQEYLNYMRFANIEQERNKREIEVAKIQQEPAPVELLNIPPKSSKEKDP